MTGRVCHALHLASLVVAALVLLRVNRNQWFFGDEWDFLVRRGVGSGELSLWLPHNEHWSTIPILVYRALFSVAGVRSYMPYIAVLVLLQVLTAHLLWRLMVRCGTGPVVALALAGLFALYGAGFENLLWAFQIGFVGSVALGLVAVLLVDHIEPDRRRDVGATALVVFALAFSAVTITMTAVAVAVVLVRRGLRSAAAFGAVPATVYGAWFLAIGHRGSGVSSTVDGDTLFTLPSYLAVGLTHAFEYPSGVPGAGPVLVLGLVAWMLRRLPGRLSSHVPAFALAAGAPLLYVGIGLARTSLGVEQAQSSRYVYLAGALVLPAVGLALTGLAGRRWVGVLTVLAALVVVALHNVGILRGTAGDEARREQAIRRQVLAAAELEASGEPLVGSRPEPVLDPDLTVSALRTLREQGHLPAAVDIGAEDRLAARVALQVAVGREAARAALGGTARLVSAGGAQSEPGPEGCRRLLPSGSPVRLVLDVAEPSRFRMGLSSPGDVTISLQLPSPAGVAPKGRTFAFTSDEEHVAVSASRVTALVDVPGGLTVSLCGVSGG